MNKEKNKNYNKFINYYIKINFHFVISTFIHFKINIH